MYNDIIIYTDDCRKTHMSDNVIMYQLNIYIQAHTSSRRICDIIY